jgi:hypothetical protein
MHHGQYEDSTCTITHTDYIHGFFSHDHNTSCLSVQMDPMGLSLYINGVSVCESHGLARQIMQVLNKIKALIKNVIVYFLLSNCLYLFLTTYLYSSGRSNVLFL